MIRDSTQSIRPIVLNDMKSWYRFSRLRTTTLSDHVKRERDVLEGWNRRFESVAGLNSVESVKQEGSVGANAR